MEQSSGIFGFLEKYLMGPMGKIAQFKFVRAIMGAGMATIPFTIVGSMFLVLNVLPDVITPLQGLFDATFFKISSLYMVANTATMGILALYFSVVLGYEYTKIIAEEDGLDLTPINGGLLSMFAFFMTIPQIILENGSMTRVQIVDADNGAFTIGGWEMGGDGITRLGTVGIFTAIIMAVVAVQLYRLCVSKNWVVKMPEAVPLGVARAFTALIPTFVISIVVLIFNGILIVLGTDIFKLVGIPFGFVTNLTNSWIGLMVIYFLVHALWLVGIHGANIVFAFIQPIALANIATNIAGGHIPLAGEFNNAFVTIGGSGATLGLVFAMMFLCKSDQLKVLGRAAVGPALFNINEPLIFGIPIIYNPFVAVPFFLAPMVSASIAYFAIKLEIIRPMIAQMPWPSPVGIGAFIGSGGDWKAGVTAVICAAAAFLIWLPFIRSYDARLVKEEQENMVAE
ncbi:PTS cellobiose transporter subunit IIC [Enterococcus saccharolyticus]|uniref:PTS cellobiose transporter subunit IIC n=1 Tax=Enterococcus TaxID=1350 RepID=UPI001E4E17FF|nr:PTS cellobiose transporter subunit IIC [Enterococcus saccharolyticus]MCD5003295.1 PTS cellobiose transporter subunit IIC [Enterococcus saccharolyticus]